MVKPSFPINSVISEYTGKETDFRQPISQFIKELKKLIRNNLTPKDLLYRQLIRHQKPEFDSYHVSAKISPHGLPSTFGCLYDLDFLNQEQINSICIVGGKLLEERIRVILKSKSILKEHFYDPVSGLVRKTPKHETVRRISVFSQPDGKTRLVAQLDY